MEAVCDDLVLMSMSSSNGLITSGGGGPQSQSFSDGVIARQGKLSV